MGKELNIIHIQDNPEDALLIKEQVKSEGMDAKFFNVNCEEDLLKLLIKEEINIILSTCSPNSFGGFSALEIIKTQYPHIPFVLVSEAVGEEIAAEYIKNGASDFILKRNIISLGTTIRRTLTEADILKRQKNNSGVYTNIDPGLFAQVSHEIKVPLTTVLKYSSLLKGVFEEKINDELNFIFDAIETSGKRLKKTLNTLTNLAAVSGGFYQPTFSQINVAELLRSLMNEFYSYASSSGISLKLDLNPDIVYITGDEHSVCQIFQNLIENAIKFTKKGEVTVRLYRDSKRCICIDVADTGFGISNEFLPLLYQPMKKDPSISSRHLEGMGMGLALTKKYVEMNKAEINVVSRQNKGTTFTVCFGNDLQ